ncbi:hypothetical protein A7M79_00215 [Acinetobacter baumannii]|uniref:hypothetical protein n=1 Tax=Acinetobacter baumannii TaxID=470 RepID=UPI0008DC724A|nr:hypothetical protein [Acinetobacter baumannii]OIH11947.1 hypothetical protein A7M79_00215 [Acinetobacter baumannii]
MSIRSLILLKKIKYLSFGDFDIFLHKNLHETTRVFAKTKELKKKNRLSWVQNILFLYIIFICLFFFPYLLIINVLVESRFSLDFYSLLEITSYILWICFGVYAFKLISFNLFQKIYETKSKGIQIDIAELAIFMYAYSSVVFFFKKESLEIESEIVSKNILEINDILFEIQSNLTIYDDIIVESKVNKKNIFSDDKKVSFNSADYKGAAKLINDFYILLHKKMKLKKEVPISRISKLL